MITSYHNSNQASGQLLINYEATAVAQEQRVLDLFRVIKKAAFFEVKKALPDIHQDSIKRSLSNLQERGLIVKDTVKSNMVRNPDTGKNCHRYLIFK